MLQRLDLRGIEGSLLGHLPRPEIAGDEPVAAVREIIETVRVGGDAAVLEYATRFDGRPPERLVVPPAQVAAAADRIEQPVRDAMAFAAERITAFHRLQLPTSHRWEQDGVAVRSVARPVDRAGCYVPGGRGAYPSTVLMTAIPAKVAGVGSVAMAVPPGADGRVADVTLAAAAIAGVDEVYAAGGAQAIAAMAHGTETMPAVDVIVGPGNVYVAVAKREVAGVVGVPSAFAGPSEIVIVADATAPPELVAVDLVLQAEHGPDGLAWLVCWDEELADSVIAAVEEAVAAAPRHDDIRSTLSANGYVALVDDAERAIEVVNLVAPEHLQLMTDDPESLIPAVRHAGVVFCGPLAPASIGDYVAGPSHVLPTNGTARFASALTVADFVKEVHVVNVTPEGFDAVAPHVEVLAAAEGFHAHADSVRRRR